MKEDEFLQDVERIMKEEEEEEESPPKKRRIKWKGKEYNPWPLIGGLVLALLIVMMAVPYYGVKLDPEPQGVPGKEVLPSNLKELAENAESIPYEGKVNYQRLMMPDNPAIKRMASKIVTESCSEGNVCHAKAIYYFVRDNVQYVSDPPEGFLENPFDTLYSGADCDGMAILLANLLLSVGINTRFAFVPGHVYVQVKIDDAAKKYKEKDGWITIDPTCKSCSFGQVPISTWGQENKDYLYVSG